MNQAATYRQPWINSAVTDSLFILFPPFGCLLFIACFPGLFQDGSSLSEVWWVVLVLLVDVAHVYSTLYRTYLDPVAMRNHKALMLAIPVAAFIAGVILYSISSLLFWRILAYTAVFHFIRQQYGFMRLYSRRDNATTWHKRIDAIAIYTATLYPIAYWHLAGDRNFSWFIQDDFVLFENAFLLQLLTVIYWLVLAMYAVKELLFIVREKQINLPKNIVLAGSFASWYFGIVYFNGDMAFTLLNVVSHGIPYMALIWIYGRKTLTQRSNSHQQSGLLPFILQPRMILLFLGIIFLLAFMEEGIWDMAVWKEHGKIFKGFNQLNFSLSADILNLLVPLLAVPQITHYVIDAFIWRKGKGYEW